MVAPRGLQGGLQPWEYDLYRRGLATPAIKDKLKRSGYLSQMFQPRGLMSPAPAQAGLQATQPMPPGPMSPGWSPSDMFADPLRQAAAMRQNSDRGDNHANLLMQAQGMPGNDVPRGTDFVPQPAKIPPGPMSPESEGFDWSSFAGAGLSALGRALLASGSGENWGSAFVQGLNDYETMQNYRRDRADKKEERELRLEDARRQVADRNKKDALDADAARQVEAILSDPAAAQSLGLTPSAIALAQVYAKSDPQQALKLLFGQSVEGASAAEPYSPIAKAKADLDAGFIDQPTYDRIVEDELRAPQGLQAPETWSQVTVNGQPMLQSSRGDLKALPGQDDGGYGNSLDGRMLNILMSGDPASQEYAMAYSHASQPKVSMDSTTGKLVMQTPNLDWARKPTYQGGATSPAPLPILPEGAPRVGPTVQSAQGNNTASLPGAQTITTDGAKITYDPGSGLSAGDRSKLRSVRAESQSIKDALTRFKDVVRETGVSERMSAVAGGMTEGGRKLNSAWTNAAIMTKAEALFNLGVLNGPDLSVIQGTLPNPATMNGAMTSDDAYNTAIDEVISLIDSKVAAFEAQYGGNPDAPPNPGGGGNVVEWERGSDGVLRPKGARR